MSFLSGMYFPNYHIQTIQTQKIKKGKEQDSYITQYTNVISHTISTERTSAITSFRGSITIEAAMAVPIFFFAVLCLIYLLEMTAVQVSIRAGAHYAGRELAEQAYVTPYINPGKVENTIVHAVGNSRLERSIVVGGSAGIHCEKSHMSSKTAQFQLVVQYKVKLPIPVFKELGMTCSDEFRMKGWTGYKKEGFGNEDKETVYITETGIVYHKDYHCTHLELSIQAVPGSSIEGLRNEGHGKYHPCEKCTGGGKGKLVYITNTGDRYHTSLGCSGLKRSVYAVPLSEVTGKGACSRCGR